MAGFWLAMASPGWSLGGAWACAPTPAQARRRPAAISFRIVQPQIIDSLLHHPSLLVALRGWRGNQRDRRRQSRRHKRPAHFGKTMLHHQLHSPLDEDMNVPFGVLAGAVHQLLF